MWVAQCSQHPQRSKAPAEDTTVWVGRPSLGIQVRSATTERQIRLMTNSHKSQSEKLAAGGGRETAAKKPYNNEDPGPHH